MGIVGTFHDDNVLFLNGSIRGEGQGASDSTTQAILNLIDSDNEPVEEPEE